MPRIHLKHPSPDDKQYLGQAWRPCTICDPGGTETNDDTEETNWFGRLYPESLMVYRDGKWYCDVHYRWRFHNKDLDAAKIEITEEDREGAVKGNTID